jgi:N-succinyldiaminopimelate aminotransferase
MQTEAGRPPIDSRPDPPGSGAAVRQYPSRNQNPLVARMQGFGTTIFAEMSALAETTGAINLGQGFPDFDGPEAMLAAAAAALAGGRNQYAPGPGIPELRQAIAEHQRRYYDLAVDAQREVLVTAGATEAIAAALLAFIEPLDEVVTFEPYYDSYAAGIALADGTRRVVPLRLPEYHFDPADLAAAITDRTRVILLNSPHNPTGKVFSRAELDLVAETARRHDLIVVTDEVYEHLVYEGAHVPIATLPGMFERTLTISSAGKTFSCTGWKIGRVSGPEPLVTAVRTVKQFLTYTNGTPFQYAIAGALALPDAIIEDARRAMAGKRDRLVAGLTAARFEVHRPAGTYFVTADVGPFGATDGLEFCRDLPARAGVVAIPTQVFYDDVKAGRSLVRFAFCKQDHVIDEAVTCLQRLGAP